jgi:hypothetical protein
VCAVLTVRRPFIHAIYAVRGSLVNNVQLLAPQRRRRLAGAVKAPIKKEYGKEFGRRESSLDMAPGMQWCW